MDPKLFELNAEIEGSHWWFAARRGIVAAVLGECVPGDSDQVVFDVGCGTGGTVASLADRYTTGGIDPNAEAIAQAQRRFPETTLLAGQAPGDAQGWIERADAVLLMDVLEHVEDDLGLLGSIVAPMRPGTHLLITVPADMRLWSPHDESHGHFRRYDVPTLRHLWTDLPLRERLVSPFNARLYPVVRALRWLSSRSGRSVGEEGSDLSIPIAPVNSVLRRVFAGERRRLVRVMRGRARPYRRGVSLIAMLRRVE